MVAEDIGQYSYQLIWGRAAHLMRALQLPKIGYWIDGCVLVKECHFKGIPSLRKTTKAKEIIKLLGLESLSSSSLYMEDIASLYMVHKH